MVLYKYSMAGLTSGMVSKEGFLAVSVLNRELKG
jgi:hypothetical protein